jgi:hypothetical protein
MRRFDPAERHQLDLFRALPGNLAPRDTQDLMAFPFFSLAKTHRTRPIDFSMKGVTIRVEAVPEHGMATIWDADVLIWAASQIVEARDAGLRTSRLMAATPREILTFTGRGVGARDYDRLRAALDRLQSTTVSTSIRQTDAKRTHRFSWINEWSRRTDVLGASDGIQLIVPDWFYQAVLDDALVLTIDPPTSILPEASRDGSTVSSASTAVISAPAGGSSSATSMPSPPAFPRSSALRSSYATSPDDNLFPAIASRSSAKSPAVNCSRSRRRGCPQVAVDNLWMRTCHQEPRTTCYREPGARAIRNRKRSFRQRDQDLTLPVT